MKPNPKEMTFGTLVADRTRPSFVSRGTVKAKAMTAAAGLKLGFLVEVYHDPPGSGHANPKLRWVGTITEDLGGGLFTVAVTWHPRRGIAAAAGGKKGGHPKAGGKSVPVAAVLETLSMTVTNVDPSDSDFMSDGTTVSAVDLTVDEVF